MTKKDFIYAMGNIDPSFIERAAPGEKIPKRKTNAFVRWGSLVACLVLIVCACIPIVRYFTLPLQEDLQFSAFEISEFFVKHGDGGGALTSDYRKEYVSSGDYLNVTPIPDFEFLSFYEYSMRKKDIDNEEFLDFVDGIVNRLSNEIGVKQPTYEVRENVLDDLYSEIVMDKYMILFDQSEHCNGVKIYNFTDDPQKKISIGGVDVAIDQRQSDEQIIASLECVKEKLFSIFGVEFSDVLINRSYSDSNDEKGAYHISVYYYNKEDHPLNSMISFPVTDSISISFNNSQDYDDAVVSDSILTRAFISYDQIRVKDDKYIPSVGNGKMISLDEAEILLDKGYVFGNHSCPICVEENNIISFEEYDYVGIKYIFKQDQYGNPTLGIPFYEFYKKIGTAENGNEIYAKTYVPAIEVSGYEEYFESQKQNHK